MRVVAAGTGLDQSSAVATDALGNAFVTGRFYNSATVGDAALSGVGTSGYLAKYDAAGVTAWEKPQQWTVTPSNGWIYPKAITMSPSGEHIYIGGEINGAGTFGSRTIPDPGPIHPFVIKVDAANGNVDWAWGPTNAGTVSRVTVDANDNVFVAGQFQGVMNLGANRSLTTQGGADVFVAQLVTTAVGGVETVSCPWGRRMGGESEEVAVDLAVTSDGAALYLLGTYLGDADFGGVTLTSQGGEDTFVVQLASATGAFLWTRSLGGPGYDGGGSAEYVKGGIVAATAADDVFIASSFSLTADLDPDPNAAALVTSGGSSTDGYVLQLTSQGDYHRAWHLGNVANSATEADQIYLQDGNVYVAGLFLGQTQLPQGTLTGDASRVNAFLFKLVPEASIPTNTPPVALDDSYKLWKNYTLTVPTFEGVLRNDSNPNLDSLHSHVT